MVLALSAREAGRRPTELGIPLLSSLPIPRFESATISRLARQLTVCGSYVTVNSR